MGLFTLLSLLIFVASLFAAGAVFGYGLLLQNQLTQKDSMLKTAEGAFEPGTIQDLVRLDARMNQSRTLISKHVSPSALFAFLSSITLERVQLIFFDYTLQPDGSGALTLAGVADTFSSVALQSDQFGASKLLRDVVFSGVNATEGGKIGFSVGTTIDSSYILYSRNLSGSTPPPPSPQ